MLDYSSELIWSWGKLLFKTNCLDFAAVDWLKLAVVTKFNFCPKTQHHRQNLLIPADTWAALVAKHQWRTSAKRLLCKTPDIGPGARGTPWKEIIFQLSCFSIYHNNAQWLSCTALPFDGCRNCRSCLHCFKFAEQVLYAVAQGNSGCQNLVHATHWPRATKVRHTGSLLYFRFPTCRSAELDADRCAKSTPQLH